MHLEAHGLYEPIHELFRKEYDKLVKPIPRPYMEDEELTMVKGVAAGYPPLPVSFFERNRFLGVDAQVVSGDFWKYKQTILHFPPLKFDTHELDRIPGWTMRVKQKQDRSRPRVSLYNKDRFGVRLRLPAKLYTSAEDLFDMIGLVYLVEGSDLPNMRMTTPPLVTQYVDREIIIYKDIVKAMAEDNAKILEQLGDWRPGKPDRTNVVDFVERLETATPTPSQFDVDEAIRKLA